MKITVTPSNDPKPEDAIKSSESWTAADVLPFDDALLDSLPYDPDEDIMYGPFNSLEEMWEALLSDDD